MKKYYKVTGQSYWEKFTDTWETRTVIVRSESISDVKEEYRFKNGDFTIDVASLKDVWTARRKGEKIRDIVPCDYSFEDKNGKCQFYVCGKDAADALEKRLIETFESYGVDWSDNFSVMNNGFVRERYSEATPALIEKFIKKCCHPWVQIPAENLPDGWFWEHPQGVGRERMDDEVGRLKSPEGKIYFQYQIETYYDRNFTAHPDTITYRVAPSLYSSFEKPYYQSHDTFKAFAEDRMHKMLTLDREALTRDEQRVLFEETREPAKTMPDGWFWEHFNDGSGHLKSPEGVTYIIYNHEHFDCIEYVIPQEDYNSYFTHGARDFDEFMLEAEAVVKEGLEHNFEHYASEPDYEEYLQEHLQEQYQIYEEASIAAIEEELEIAELAEDREFPSPIGRIDYLHVDGRTRESIEYTNPYQLQKDIEKENYYGVPMSVVLYKQADGSVVPHKYIAECDPPLNGFSIIDDPHSQISRDTTKEITDRQPLKGKDRMQELISEAQKNAAQKESAPKIPTKSAELEL